MSTFSKYDYLNERYVRLPRGMVTSGDWAAAVAANEAGIIRTLPVLALLSVGREDDGVYCTHRDLLRLTGATDSELVEGFRRLTAASFLTLLPCERSFVHRFRVHGALTTAKPAFYFPGRLVANDTWSDLTLDACTMLIAIAALARTTYEEASYHVDNEPIDTDIWAWLDEELGAVEEVEPYGHFMVRRVACRTLDELTELSGLGLIVVEKALRALQLSDVIEMRRDDEGAIWCHSPETNWAPVETTEDRRFQNRLS